MTNGLADQNAAKVAGNPAIGMGAMLGRYPYASRRGVLADAPAPMLVEANAR